MKRRTLMPPMAVLGFLTGMTGAGFAADVPKDALAFMHEAAAGGKAEVQLGKLAADKGSTPDVKAFGQRMVVDHSKAGDELQTLAAHKSVTLPAGLDAKHQATYDRLAKLSGLAFDQAYMDDMTADHVHDVDAFKQAAKSSDAEVAEFARRTLPTLEEHLKEARRVQSEVASARSGRDGAIIPAGAK